MLESVLLCYIKEILANVEKCQQNPGSDVVIPSFTRGKHHPGDENGQFPQRKAPAFFVV